MINVREIELKEKSNAEIKQMRPVVIKWKDQSMIRSHSIRATVKEIIQAIQAQDVVNINIIGDPSSGKTTLAKLLAHLIHKMSDIPFAVRFFTKTELLNFESTLKTLSPANYVLLFDDVSFLGANATKKQIEIVKQAVSEIRHLPGGQDVKIINIKDFHYTLGVDKFLRQNDFSYFSTIGSSEDDNMEKIVKSRNMPLVHAFKKMKTRIRIAPEEEKKFTYMLGTNHFTYGYRKPFIPLLYWNNDTLRNVVSPKREWVDKYCAVCSLYGSDEKFDQIIDVSQFIEESGAKFSESTFKHCVKLKLYSVGINVFDPREVSAGRYLDRALDTGKITLEQIATHYGFVIPKVRLRKPLDGVLTDTKEVKEDTKKD